MKLARSEAEAYSLALLARSWSGLAGQIDRYNALMRQRSGGQRFSAEGSGDQDSRRGTRLTEIGDD